ncbi:DUF4352 domain-containing protein [Heyndrickxia sp. MSNUG]|uniref:DUF4352 domain-containing protein n=1 Tax=Heyndrickxia sp. MSNUG TaxID=3136677 RepID=UPI003C2FBC93
MEKYLSFLLAISILSGCSAAAQEDPAKGSKADGAVKASEEPKIPNKYVPNPQVTDDSTLKKAGDTVTDRKGELTLKAIKKVNKHFTLEGIQYTINDIKLIHYVPDYSMIDFFHPYTHEEEFDFVKMGIEIENTSKENYHFAPVALMKVNGSIHKTWEDDFYLEELNGEIAAGQMKKGSVGFIVDELDGLSEIEILSGDLVGADKKKKASPVRLTIPIN